MSEQVSCEMCGRIADDETGGVWQVSDIAEVINGEGSFLCSACDTAAVFGRILAGIHANAVQAVEKRDVDPWQMLAAIADASRNDENRPEGRLSVAPSGGG